MRRPAVTLGALLVLGCNPTFAPPMRLAHGGGPGRVAPTHGAVTAGGGLGGYGSLGVMIPLPERFHLEASGSAWEYGATGTLGVRYTHRARRLAMDGEFGLGGGAGGTLCGNDDRPDEDCVGGLPTGPMGQRRADGLDAWSRYTFGGYAGVGVGVRVWRSLGVFGRTRVQLSRARNVPTTFWASAIGGIEGTLGPFDLYVGAGWAAYFNEYDRDNTLVLEGGITLPFPVRSAP
jgi:hypothetical protein